MNEKFRMNEELSYITFTFVSGSRKLCKKNESELPVTIESFLHLQVGNHGYDHSSTTINFDTRLTMLGLQALNCSCIQGETGLIRTKESSMFKRQNLPLSDFSYPTRRMNE